MRSRLLILLCLFALSAAIYQSVSRFGFVEYDDPYYINNNPQLAGGLDWPNIRYAFTTFTCANWHPLVWLSYEADQSFWQLNPHAMHVENVVIHALAAGMLFLMLAGATGSTWRSATVAALFACHPMHVESVAWISERKDVMSTLLLFTTIALYVRYTRADSVGTKSVFFIATLFLFATSLLAKPMGVTLPGILFLLDFWPLKRLDFQPRKFGHILLEKIPFLLLSFASSIMTMRAQQSYFAVNPVALAARLSNAVVCFVIYAAKLFVPMNLAVFYPLPPGRPLQAVVVSLLLLILVTIAAVRMRQRHPYLLVGWFWFCGTLLPVIGLVQVGGQAMADRYSYLPSVGLCIAVIWGAFDLVRWCVRYRSVQIAAGGLLAAAVILSFTLLARQQVNYWQSNQTLFSHAMEVTDSNYLAAGMLGRAARASGDLPTAYAFFRQAIQFNPTYAYAYDEIGHCMTERSPGQAAIQFRSAVKYDARSIDYRIDLVDALRRSGQVDAALIECQNARVLEPTSKILAQELASLKK